MFLGHTSDLKPGQSKPLMTHNNNKLLSNVDGKYRLGSNICPHQNSRIISCETQELKCQYHGWSWNSDGTPKGSGSCKMSNTIPLFFKDTCVYKGLIFEKNINLEMLGDVSFENLTLDEFRIDNCKADPKITMDIFLDVDHIPTVHNGVYDLLGIEGDADVTWNYTDWGSVQTVVDANNTVIARWIAIYPYTMIEWQVGFLFVTQSIDDNKIAVWKYKNSSSTDEAYKVNSEMWESAFSQDKNQATQMYRFPSTHLEFAKEHYRKWLKENNYELRI